MSEGVVVSFHTRHSRNHASRRRKPSHAMHRLHLSPNHPAGRNIIIIIHLTPNHPASRNIIIIIHPSPNHPASRNIIIIIHLGPNHPASRNIIVIIHLGPNHPASRNVQSHKRMVVCNGPSQRPSL